MWAVWQRLTHAPGRASIAVSMTLRSRADTRANDGTRHGVCGRARRAARRPAGPRAPAPDLAARWETVVELLETSRRTIPRTKRRPFAQSPLLDQDGVETAG